MSDGDHYGRGLPGALMAIHVAVGGTSYGLAARLSMSVRSLARFMHGSGRPSPAVARTMLIDVADLPKPLFDRLADALRVPVERRPMHKGDPRVAHSAAPVVRAVDTAAETAALNLAVYVAAEASDVPPGTARTLFAAALDHVASRGLDAATARALLAATSPPKK